MSLCVQCGHPTFGPDSLCLYHAASYGEDWAAGNRIMCDFLHRGIVSPSPLTRDGRGLRGRVERLHTPAQL